MSLLLINPNISEQRLRTDRRRGAAQRRRPAREIDGAHRAVRRRLHRDALRGAGRRLCRGRSSPPNTAAGPRCGGGRGLRRPRPRRLREAADVPVVGLTEAALMSACLLGQRFSIVAISQRISAWYREVRAGQRPDRAAGQHPRPRPAAGGHRRACRTTTRARLQALCARAVDEDGADVIIIAGAPLAGLARSMRGRLPVPVVDGVSSAVRHARNAWSRCSRAARGAAASRRRPIKPNKGLPEALAHALAAGPKPLIFPSCPPPPSTQGASPMKTRLNYCGLLAGAALACAPAGRARPGAGAHQVQGDRPAAGHRPDPEEQGAAVLRELRGAAPACRSMSTTSPSTRWA